MSCAAGMMQGGTAPGGRLAAWGEWMRRHRGVIQGIQWGVVGVYAFLLIVPTLLPLPPYTAGILDNLTVFAQFVFWGIWWPFVLLSIVLMGRVWCGVFCPEGTLTEFASRHGRGGAIPRWVRWGGWPFVAFVGTTLYGQMASVYDYPGPALIVLGGSTVAAMIVGFLYGRDKRVWCRYLCPVNGVFRLLSRLSPLHYRTHEDAWQAARRSVRPERVNCPTLLALRELDEAGGCHMCGRCSGYRGAIALEPRLPGSEITRIGARNASGWEYVLLVFGLIGTAIGAFHWSASPWFVTAKQAIATWLVHHDWMWPLTMHAPWWVFTNYPGENDVFNLLDGALLIVYIATTAVVVGSAVTAALALGTRAMGQWRPQRLYHLAHSLIPLGGIGAFLGLSMTTVSLLRADGVPVFWVGETRALLLAAATAWSLGLAWRITAVHVPGQWLRRLGGFAGGAAAAGVVAAAWWLLFWGW
ncbi:hypothetical protein KBTX_00694 [wastewater metagenome]|uniref:4Fe-4S ferredoxin-type domain-containing protein n=2 Tax=unclassified sequences TaxID=12908 RepID=A0A5B8R6S7_9ZZZZ|nr:4Fe-4S binding protein [Arhodomonas sp. KWT]QEA04386.1 hypothetical protein KBTEX_00694 [uncultured organism]